jgi:hypothetical protein
LRTPASERSKNDAKQSVTAHCGGTPRRRNPLSARRQFVRRSLLIELSASSVRLSSCSAPHAAPAHALAVLLVGRGPTAQPSRCCSYLPCGRYCRHGKEARTAAAAAADHLDHLQARRQAPFQRLKSAGMVEYASVLVTLSSSRRPFCWCGGDRLQPVHFRAHQSGVVWGRSGTRLHWRSPN